MRSTSLSPPRSSRAASGNGWMPKPSGRRATRVRTQRGVVMGSGVDSVRARSQAGAVGAYCMPRIAKNDWIVDVLQFAAASAIAATKRKVRSES
jgi:hypothetical protein